MALALVLATLLALVVLVAWLVSGFRVVPVEHRAVIERFGRYRRTVSPGLHPTWRFFDTVHLVDMREMVQDVPVDAMSADDVSLGIDLVVFHECTDPRPYVYDVGDVPLALARLAETHLRGLLRELTVEEAVTSVDRVTAVLSRSVDEVAQLWGARVTRVEVARVELPEDLSEALQAKATAERDRQVRMLETETDILTDAARSEGEHQARLRRVEVRQAMLLMNAERKAAAVRILADAERYRQEALARAQAESIRIVSGAIQQGWASPDLVGIRYVEVEGASGTGQAVQIVLPSAPEPPPLEPPQES